MTIEQSATIEGSPLGRARRPVGATAVPTKSASVIKLLLRARGATPPELVAATDWQPHSVRAFLSGLRKQGRSIVREARKTGEFAYRIEAASVEPATTPAMAVEQGER